ncbi:hypothetical protein RP20_CCG021202 [Aedes albopictus]|nr:hypothetical protein RP20_CCG021202 [Aedes albopictus]
MKVCANKKFSPIHFFRDSARGVTARTTCSEEYNSFVFDYFGTGKRQKCRNSSLFSRLSCASTATKCSADADGKFRITGIFKNSFGPHKLNG